MAKDMKGMEKMVKPALEKFMKESGFVKKDELDKANERIDSLEKRVAELEKLQTYSTTVRASSMY